MRLYNVSRFWLAVGCVGLVVFGLLIGLGTAFIGLNQAENLFEVVSLIRSNYIEEASLKQLLNGATKGIVDSLDDPYSVYLEPKTYQHLKEQIRGSFGGLGIVVGIRDEQLTVIRPFPDTPAGRAGIKAGDVIVKIGDHRVEGLDLETAVNLMRGPVGTKVTITIMRQGSKPLQVTLTREEISVPSVEGKLLPEKIGYISVAQFTEKTPHELSKVINDLRNKGMRAVILDLRDNPGGELNAAVAVADNFVPKGPVVYVRYREGRDEVHKADAYRLSLPLVVLVNENSASAAEIVAGAVKDTGAGVVMGVRTYGKGVVQTVYDLKNGAGLKLTTAKYLTPKKRDINNKGVEPDVKVEQPVDAQTDVQLSAAQARLYKDLNEHALPKAAGE
ncbi:MAG: S41 family peptidase [Bacillota bacterium]